MNLSLCIRSFFEEVVVQDIHRIADHPFFQMNVVEKNDEDNPLRKLIHAARIADIADMKQAVKEGADPRKSIDGDNVFTALASASFRIPAAVAYLTDGLGLSPDLYTHGKKTGLQRALHFENAIAARSLLEAGAKPVLIKNGKIQTNAMEDFLDELPHLSKEKDGKLGEGWSLVFMDMVLKAMPYKAENEIDKKALENLWDEMFHSEKYAPLRKLTTYDGRSLGSLYRQFYAELTRKPEDGSALPQPVVAQA